MKLLFPLACVLVSFQSMAAIGETVLFQFNQDIHLKKPAAESDVLTAKLNTLHAPEHEEYEPGLQRNQTVLRVTPGRSTTRTGCLLQKKTSPEVSHGVIKGLNGSQWTLTMLKHEKDKETPPLTLGLGYNGSLIKTTSNVYIEEFEFKNADGVTLQMFCRNSCADSAFFGRSKGISCENKVAAEPILKSLGVNLPDVELEATQQRQTRDESSVQTGAK